MTRYQHIQVPAEGHKITVNADMSLNVPDEPIIPFIEGDGTGADITPVMIKVVDAAVAKAYGGKKKIHWMEVFAGEKSTRVYGAGTWLPDETVHAIKDCVVSIKGPLTTPVGGGTALFVGDVKRLRPIDPEGGNTYGGWMTAKADYKKDRSMLTM